MLTRIESLLEDKQLDATNWERGFLQSISDQVDKGRTLSGSQIGILERIEDKNNLASRSKLRDWTERWESEYASIARVVAQYYLTSTLYFSSQAEKVIAGGVLHPREYKKMCENKYAERVIEEHFKKPRFSVGSFVQVRKSPSINKHYLAENGSHTRLNNMHAVVLEVDALPVRRAAKGAKVYKVLPVGAPRAYYVSESDLKAAKKRK